MVGVGCKTGGAAGGGATSAGNATVPALTGEYWEQRMLADPVEATLIGDRRFDDRLPDESPAALDFEMARLRALRARVANVNVAALSAADRITQALLLGQLDDDLARGECNLDEWSVDPREGPQVEYLRLAELQPVSTVAQGTALVARWRAMGPAIDQKIANLRRALAASKVAARDDVVRTLKQLDDLLAQPNASWVLRAPAAQVHGDWSAAARAAFTGGIDDAIATSIRPAFARYRAVVHDEILARARDQAHVGLLNIA
ncbi:MAG TPA: DUF885 family protein, partial [Polyangia bacterium]